jgi:hypothetical protein
MTRSLRGVIVAVTAAVGVAIALAFIGVFGASGASPRTGPLVVDSGLAAPPARFVRGDGLYDGKGAKQRLEAPVSGALMGPLSPVAVASPDGSSVAYSAWHELRSVDSALSFSAQRIRPGDALAVPSLRVADDEGHDFLVARGAYSAAWRTDGALAYVQGVEPSFRAGEIYDGRVYVRRGIHGPAVEWTTEPARYVVYAWAGERLLLYRIGAGESLELLVADGPGRVRPFADGSAVAVSPDGTRVAVLSPDAASIRVLDVASGREQAWLDVTTSSPALRWIGYSGSWTRDRVVAPASSGLAVFRVGQESIQLEQALSLSQAEFPAGVQEPLFAGKETDEIVATAEAPAGDGDAAAFFLDCDRLARTCARGTPVPAKEWPRLVRNPSRPGRELP